MDFDQLNTFIQVANLRSFSRAGQKVFRSQSAVSAQIRQLEHEYGQQLLDRSGKTVSLTPAGEVFFEYAERLLALQFESLRAVASKSATPSGMLAVGANDATCLYVLPEVFGEYSHKYPQVQISIYRNFSRKILEKIEDGSLDVGVVTMPVKSASLKVKPIFRDRMLCMVSTRNPLSEKSSVTVAEMARQTLIYPKTGFTRQVFDKIFRPYRGKLRIAMEIPSVSMIKRFVAADVGVSLISETYATDQVRSGEAKLLPLKGLSIHRELAVVFRSDRTLPRAAVAFIELCDARAAQYKQKAAAQAPETK
jgi:DNA-binding transcriptional LysR family regulator